MPSPTRGSSTPISVSARTASRSELRERPSRCARSCSFGSFESGGELAGHDQVLDLRDRLIGQRASRVPPGRSRPDRRRGRRGGARFPRAAARRLPARRRRPRARSRATPARSRRSGAQPASRCRTCSRSAPKRVDGDGDGLAEVAGVPVARREHRVQPRDLGGHVARARPRAAARSAQRPHLARCRAAACRGGRSRSSGPGSDAASSGTSPRWRGKTHGKLEDQPPLLEQREALEHARPGGSSAGRRSSWMRWRMPAQLRLLRRARRAARASARARARSTQAITAPIHACSRRVLEHGVGVGVGAGGLDEHGRARPRARRAAARGRRARTSRRIDVVLGRHPGHGPPARGSRSADVRRRSRVMLRF